MAHAGCEWAEQYDDEYGDEFGYEFLLDFSGQQDEHDGWISIDKNCLFIFN